VFSVLHCIVQLIPQSQAFRINDQAASFLRSVISQGNAVETGFPVLDDDDLRICDHVPTPFNVSTCQIIWDGTPGSSNSIGIANNQSIPIVPTTVSQSYSPCSILPTASSMSSTSLGAAVTSFSANPTSTGAPAVRDAVPFSNNAVNVRHKLYKKV
jgi:hypothetical protein